MNVTSPEVSLESPECVSTLVASPDASSVDWSAMSQERLIALQWEHERVFAREILAAPKGSPARAEATRRAYETVPRIFAAARRLSAPGPSMGYHPRQGRLVVERLARHRRLGHPARLFEIGYGNGSLLKHAAEAGFTVAGIEVSSALCEQARRSVGIHHAASLYRGDFLRDTLPIAGVLFAAVYWNDVFEHIPPDEILDYLRRIHQMLAPGGELITVTPNWHIRPSDVTVAILGPRSEPAGLHFKEYTLGEVTALLREAGFRRVFTPLAVTRKRFWVCGSGLAGLKRWAEPTLEWLPYRLARLLCRGLGLSTTIAVK